MIEKEKLKEDYQSLFVRITGKKLKDGNKQEKIQVLTLLLRDYISEQWSETNEFYLQEDSKQIYYFSIEFLPGTFSSFYLDNLGIKEVAIEAFKELNLDLLDIIKYEVDAGLGNGGLGRLAACFLDSMATLGIAGHGNGIYYRYGLFEQKIIEGQQVELPDEWQKNGYNWAIAKPDKSVLVNFFGEVLIKNVDNRMIFEHVNYQAVKAIPYDIPIVGNNRRDNVNNVNTLRLWKAEPLEKDFDFVAFSQGRYHEAVEYISSKESISQVLYPDDSNYQGKELRLKQQYFFVSAGLQSILRFYKRKRNSSWEDFPKKVAIHINDTHPALCIPELMRILIDIEGLEWDKAWKIVTETISYTNHTVLPEALEVWSVEMFKNLLPRIYMIIEEINRRFLEIVVKKHDSYSMTNSLSIIKNNQIHMANLAIVGSHSVNGVAELHTEIIKKNVMKDFYIHCPQKFNNKTNGVTHRRFLVTANKKLSGLITEAIGDEWINNPEKMIELKSFVNDCEYLKKVYSVKRENKIRLAEYIEQKNCIRIDPDSIFDVQIKRIHAYKRQLLNALHIMDLYNRIKDNPNLEIEPRTFIFSGKAAPGYYYAKKIIRLINSIANKINNDRDIRGLIKVVFLENFNVSLGELIYPAANVSEQISTAGKEASGTGNMKFMMNGAITLGTLDGANIEILEKVGEENIVIFGLTSEETERYYVHGGYYSRAEYENNPRIKRVLDQLCNDFFPDRGTEFLEIFESLTTHNDEYFVLKDFMDYAAAQDFINEKRKDKEAWCKMVLNNIAQSGYFSSDRTIKEYFQEIWKGRSIST